MAYTISKPLFIFTNFDLKKNVVLFLKIDIPLCVIRACFNFPLNSVEITLGPAQQFELFRCSFVPIQLLK